MTEAVENVYERLRRVSTALNSANIPYAVIGGNAVAAWIARVDVSAVRNTKDVDLLLRRQDLDNVEKALSQHGFVRRRVAGMEMFLDSANPRARDAVHVVFAGEKVRQNYLLPAPDVTETDVEGSLRLLQLDALVRMKLTSFRLVDRVHLEDMVEVGLIDERWFQRVPPELHERLKSVLEQPGE